MAKKITVLLLRESKMGLSIKNQVEALTKLSFNYLCLILSRKEEHVAPMWFYLHSQNIIVWFWTNLWLILLFNSPQVFFPWDFEINVLKCHERWNDCIILILSKLCIVPSDTVWAAFSIKIKALLSSKDITLVSKTILGYVSNYYM